MAVVVELLTWSGLRAVIKLHMTYSLYITPRIYINFEKSY